VVFYKNALKEFEQTHQLSPQAFLERFESGQLEDVADLLCPEKPGPPPHGGIFDGPSLSRFAGVRVLWLCLKNRCKSLK